MFVLQCLASAKAELAAQGKPLKRAAAEKWFKKNSPFENHFADHEHFALCLDLALKIVEDQSNRSYTENRGDMDGRGCVESTLADRGASMLKCVGSIERDEDPTISLATWQEVIEAFELRPIESCEIVNPFTKEPMTLNDPRELAALVVGEQRVGVVRWCSRGKGFDILGEPDAMTRLAEAIAERIGGDFVPL
jgi:hypothetical protein